ncbi:MAG TPA: hypothetical protein ENJ37_06815 [Deltaproteobacteria bacterium]|nr:hypothetical protein [Deltaproteobacteria bacterium]
MAVLLWIGSAQAARSDFSLRFEAAFNEGEGWLMTALVQENLPVVAAEVEALVAEALAPGTSRRDFERFFLMAERMASEFAYLTDDAGPLVKVRTSRFDAELSEPARSEAVDGAHLVRATLTEKGFKVFAPDNIVIGRGETVRWVSEDGAEHRIVSVRTHGGAGGLSSPEIAPGAAWEHRFDEPGSYYYVCVIHRTMFGKVTVEE